MPKFHVQRSIEINAARAEVFRRVADFSTWQIWSPWLIAEPDANVTVSDDPSAVGATYAWDGEVVGAGQMTHQRMHSSSFIENEIHYKKMKQLKVGTFEIYRNTPDDVPDTELITDIYLPLK